VIFVGKRQTVNDGKDEQIAELERMVERLTMELYVLKKVRHSWPRVGSETGSDRSFETGLPDARAMSQLELALSSRGVSVCGRRP
jgi:hypothetical protein